MAKVYKNMSIYIEDAGFKTKIYSGPTENLTSEQIKEKNENLNLTDAELREKYGPAYESIMNNPDENGNVTTAEYEITYETLDLPFLPEKLEIKFDGNNAIEYLANGDFFTSKKKPQPKEIEITSFFPGTLTQVQVNKGLNKTRKWKPAQWRNYFFDAMTELRTVILTFTRWNFSFDCIINKFYTNINSGEVDDTYYTLLFKEAKNPIINSLLTIYAQGHNSWITHGEWQLTGSNNIQTANISTTEQIAQTSQNQTINVSTTPPISNATTQTGVYPTTAQPNTDNEITGGSYVMLNQPCTTSWIGELDTNFARSKNTSKAVNMNALINRIYKAKIYGTVINTGKNDDGYSYCRIKFNISSLQLTSTEQMSLIGRITNSVYCCVQTQCLTRKRL